MTDTELKEQALNKYNKISMGNGSDGRTLKLYNIHSLLSKEKLNKEDRQQLQHFVNATKQEIEQTAYIANTIISPMSWGHTTTVLARKRTIVDK